MSNKKLTYVMRCVVAGLLMLAFMAACSRQEKSKEPVKKSQALTVAPTPMVATGAVAVVKVGPTGGMHRVRTRPTMSSPEAKQALRERQTAFMKKMDAQSTPKIQNDLDDVTEKMALIEVRAQSENADIKARWQELQNKKQAYDDVRYGLPGMNELRQKRELAKLKLAEIKSRRQGGADSEVDKEMLLAKTDVKQFGDMMFKIESVARTNSPVLMQAVAGLQQAEKGYGESLLELPEYKAMDVKRQELSKIFNAILERQAGMAQQEKQHE